MDFNMHGMRPPYQNKWKDKKTGQERTSPIWSIAYSIRGEVIRESSHSKKQSDAWKLLKKRHGEIALGKPVGPDLEKTTFEDIAAMVINDYKANGRKSLARQEDAIGHLREYFGDFRAVEITSDTVVAYVTHRQAQSAANSTINNELSAVSRMLVLGVRSGRVATKPHIAKLATAMSEKGFSSTTNSRQSCPICLTILSPSSKSPISQAGESIPRYSHVIATTL